MENSNTEQMLPESDLFKFPSIPYILGIQKPKTANSDTDPFGLFIGVNQNSDDNFDGLIITPPRKEDVENNKINANEEAITYSGCEISFTDKGSLNFNNNFLCSIKDSVIGVSKKDNLVYLLHLNKETQSYRKLWLLPGEIFSLLYLDRIPINYSFAIEEDSFIVCKIKLPSYLHDEPVVDSSNTINLQNNVKAFIYDGQNQEQIEKSYLYIDDNKFYIKDLSMNIKNDNILISYKDQVLGSCKTF